MWAFAENVAGNVAAQAVYVVTIAISVALIQVIRSRTGISLPRPFAGKAEEEITPISALVLATPWVVILCFCYFTCSSMIAIALAQFMDSVFTDREFMPPAIIIWGGVVSFFVAKGVYMSPRPFRRIRSLFLDGVLLGFFCFLAFMGVGLISLALNGGDFEKSQESSSVGTIIFLSVFIGCVIGFYIGVWRILVRGTLLIVKAQNKHEPVAISSDSQTSSGM